MTYETSKADLEKIEKAFTYHAPQGDQPSRYVSIRDNAKELAIQMTQYAPPSRELSLALTNLEQAVMWCNAAIARNE